VKTETFHTFLTATFVNFVTASTVQRCMKSQNIAAEEYKHLGCDAMQFARCPLTFQRNVAPQLMQLKTKQRKKPARNRAISADFFIGLASDMYGGASMFP
jgi:hypothetical protein